MAKHLHEQAGGDPSQGPTGKMANPQPSPGTGNDFPDVPAGNAPGGIDGADADGADAEGADADGDGTGGSEREDL